MRGLVASWRIARAVLHGLHGWAIVVGRFPGIDEAARHAAIRWWSRKMLRVLGIAMHCEGPLPAPGTLVVVNHVSWLDILCVHAVVPSARFVSKADVQAWPLVARLIDAAGTIYLERARKRDALRVVRTMNEALVGGAIVAVFPEGTTSDGHGLLPFHANLLQAAIAGGVPVQPAALRFSDRLAPVSGAVEFIGETTLAQSLWGTACGDGVVARLVFLAPRASAGAERRALAAALRADIGAALGVA